jgi:hypothetical protein
MADDREREPESETVDISHELDLVPFFRSSSHDAEMEAMSIHAILQSNNIPSVLVGPSQIPSLEFQVQVPRNLLDDAERVVADARAAGPEAADEAEKASEG